MQFHRGLGIIMRGNDAGKPGRVPGMKPTRGHLVYVCPPANMGHDEKGGRKEEFQF